MSAINSRAQHYLSHLEKVIDGKRRHTHGAARARTNCIWQKICCRQGIGAQAGQSALVRRWFVGELVPLVMEILLVSSGREPYGDTA